MLPTQFSRTYHVSPLGLDLNDGGPDRPLKTIQKALDLAQPGERVLLAPGIYNERL
ncbi:MAG: DUF1565 domain-containing protein, partial [Lentisphaerae bacterium]|nr:DUF1565 domain-containing protein [Lentisphaerota bacterium]